jgi:plasmid stability protein
MSNLQVKNVPDALHERLRRHAREHNRTMSDIVLSAVERELEMHEWRERWAKRPETDLGVSAASLILEERLARDQELA